VGALPLPQTSALTGVRSWLLAVPVGANDREAARERLHVVGVRHGSLGYRLPQMPATVSPTLSSSGVRILFAGRNMDAEPWLAALRQALPGATVEAWSPGVSGADYAVVWMPTQQFFDEQQRLKAIFNIGAGIDALLRLDLPAGVPIVRITDGGMAAQMAEYVCHAVIRFFRQFGEYDRDAASGVWGARPPRLRSEFPAGVMGLGALGVRVARAIAGFDFPVRGWSRTPKSVAGATCFAGPDEFDAFLAGTRTLVCLLPLTPETEGIINQRSLSRLLPGGYVINVARGAHVVEEDLLAGIESGHIAGAALDVFRTEPLPADHPFWRHPSITVTPHVSARTLRPESIAQIAGRIRALDRGEPIEGVVDRTLGY